MVKRKRYNKRRFMAVFVLLVGAVVLVLTHPNAWEPAPEVSAPVQAEGEQAGGALQALETLPVKGRAAKTGYARTQFGNGWTRSGGCDTRNIILYRDLTDVVLAENCLVARGTLHDPYSGTVVQFERGATTSQAVQIDHVVALSNAWQTGAQQLTAVQRIALANDPLNLLAVDGPSNQQKSDGDAATWLPSNKAFRCQYIARQIAVKQRYSLWITEAEKEAMARTLTQCPSQALPL